MNQKSVLEWYANPLNWKPAEDKEPGPYSATGQIPAMSDKGKMARHILKFSDNPPSAIFHLQQLTGFSNVEIASRTGIHPGRIDDILTQRANILPDEAEKLSKLFGVERVEVYW